MKDIKIIVVGGAQEIEVRRGAPIHDIYAHFKAWDLLPAPADAPPLDEDSEDWTDINEETKYV